MAAKSESHESCHSRVIEQRIHPKDLGRLPSAHHPSFLFRYHARVSLSVLLPAPSVLGWNGADIFHACAGKHQDHPSAISSFFHKDLPLRSSLNVSTTQFRHETCISPTTSFLPDLAHERATSPLFKASAFAFRSFPLLIRLPSAFAPLGNKRHHHRRGRGFLLRDKAPR